MALIFASVNLLVRLGMGRGDVIDLTGQSFGRLIVESRAANIRTQAAWNCLCSCGNRVVRSGGNLRYGQSFSCGCQRREKLVARNAAGMRVNSKGADYMQWRSMIKRCHNQSSNNFKNYGAKGIEVCQRWRDSYQNFRQDMGPRPPGLSIDRIDNNKGYEPGNCRWADAKTQAANRRNVGAVHLNGVDMTYPDACAIHGVNYQTFMHRIKYLGWAIDKALKTPALQRKRG